MSMKNEEMSSSFGPWTFCEPGLMVGTCSLTVSQVLFIGTGEVPRAVAAQRGSTGLWALSLQD